MRQILSPWGSYSQPIWLSNNQLALGYETELEDLKQSHHIWLMQSDGSNLKMLVLPKEYEQCEGIIRFGSPLALADGRLAFIRDCPKKVINNGDYYDDDILVWDPTKNVTEFLYGYKLTNDVRIFALEPDLSKGIASSFNRIEDELFWMDTQGLTLIELGLARSNRPAWSSDGKLIAFFGNRDLQGKPGPDWATQSYDLWLMSAGCETLPSGCADDLKIVAKNITDPSKVTWSPDGKWLAFVGALQSQGLGIWLIQIDTGAITQIAAGDYRWPDWSPNGQQILVAGPREKSNLGIEYRPTLYILDSSQIIDDTTGTP